MNAFLRVLGTLGTSSFFLFRFEKKLLNFILKFQYEVTRRNFN